MNGTMTRAEIDIFINEHREQEKELRNRMLRARLARPLSSEEYLARLSTLADYIAPRREGEIPLTNSSAQYIMEVAR